MVRWQACCQRLRNWEALVMPGLDNHLFAERRAYLGKSLSKDALWRRKLRAVFPRLKSDPKAEGRRRLWGEALFVCKYCKALRNLSGSNELFQSRKELSQDLLVGSASDPLMKRLDWSMEEVRSYWNLVPGSSFLNNSEFSLTWQLAPTTLPLLGLIYKAGLVDMLDWLRWRNSCARLLLLLASSLVLGSRRDDGPDLSGPYPRIVGNFLFPILL